MEGFGGGAGFGFSCIDGTRCIFALFQSRGIQRGLRISGRVLLLGRDNI